jgi:hypothetical protein
LEAQSADSRPGASETGVQSGGGPPHSKTLREVCGRLLNIFAWTWLDLLGLWALFDGFWWDEKPPDVGYCNVSSGDRATYPVAEAMHFALAMAYLDYFSCSLAMSLARGWDIGCPTLQKS